MGKIQIAGIGCGTIAGAAHIPSHIDRVIITARMMQAIYDSSDRPRGDQAGVVSGHEVHTEREGHGGLPFVFQIWVYRKDTRYKIENASLRMAFRNILYLVSCIFVSHRLTAI